jgi:Retron-type reverse transcriptase
VSSTVITIILLMAGIFLLRLFIRFSRNKHKSFDNQAIVWCANFLSVDKQFLKKMLYKDLSNLYRRFSLKKRKGGYRSIYCPNEALMAIQKTIYNRILSTADIHPAATGFRKGMSIVNNTKPHLGKEDVIKADILNYFGSIKQDRVTKAFMIIGYPADVSKVLAELCCINGHLPQGAPTSPALSNIIAYEMDKKLTSLSHKFRMTYTRYADDLTFSGDNINMVFVFFEIKKIINEENFSVNNKKTNFIIKNQRKIITGISISSGTKLTIPKSKKREIRKNVHFILTKGLAEHQRFIQSTDPFYLKKLICYLSFWNMVEPENQYVTKSIASLRNLRA